MKTVIKGFIVLQKWRWEEKGEITFRTYDPRLSTEIETHRVVAVIQEHEFEVETPDNFDPRPQQVQALEKERQKLRADFAKRCAEIERQISELTCLEATVNAELAAHRESLAVMA